jgi:hypothetical protein
LNRLQKRHIDQNFSPWLNHPSQLLGAAERVSHMFKHSQRERSVNLTQISHLALSATGVYRNGLPRLCYMQSNENFATLIHVSSPALRKSPPNTSNPRRVRSMERGAFIGTDIRSY